MPLLAALRGRGGAARAGLGALAGGIAGAALVLEPTGVALARYFELAPAAAGLGAFALSLLYGALPFALFGALAGDPSRGGAPLACARIGAALAVSEGLRGVLFGGLPWGLLAYALAPAPRLSQAAALGGAALLGFALAALNAAWLRSRPLALALLGALALPGLQVPGGGAAPGAVTPAPDAAAPPAGALRVRLVQGALPAAWRRDPRRVDDALARLRAAGAGAPVELAVWPESAFRAPLPENLSRLRGAAPDAAFLLLGAPRTEARDGAASLYNSAVLLAADGRLLAAHDKTRLVPVAETRRETSGGAPRALALGARRIGALVCYELIFAEVSRALVRDGAEVLVNLSNDEWFGTTRGIEQHFAAAAVRAIETRRPLLRATNTGRTAAVDAWGRVVAQLPGDAPGALTVDVWPARELTLAVRLGDWVTWGSLAALAAGGALRLRSRHGHEAPARRLA